MKISAISYLNNQTQKTQNVNLSNNKGSQKPIMQDMQMPTSLNYSDILFTGSRKEKKQVLARANAHMRHALRPMSDVRFYVQKTNEVAPEIYASIIDEENKATNTIKEVYGVLDKALKGKFKTFTKEDGTKVEIEVVKEDGKTAQITMLEYDKEENLARETKIKGISIEEITIYNPETVDIISVGHSKPLVVAKGVTNGAKNDANSHISALYTFADSEKKSVSYNVDSTSSNAYSIERDYTFNSRGILDEMLFLHKVGEDGSKESQIELKFSYTSKADDLRPETVKKGVKIDKDGNLKADEIVEMHFLGEQPVKISKNVEQNFDGTRKSDYVYMFSGGKLLMVKSREEKTRDEYRADRIYKFTRHGLDEYMEKCSMPIGSGKSNNYSSEKKIEF